MRRAVYVHEPVADEQAQGCAERDQRPLLVCRFLAYNILNTLHQREIER